MHTDDNGVALGATFSQEDKRGNLQLIACASRKSAAERKYHAHKKECLAVVDSLQRCQYYLRGAGHVIFHTNNITNKYLNTMKDTSQRINHWLEKLSWFNCEISHISWTTNPAADALSCNLSVIYMDPKVITASRTTLKRFLRLSLQPVVPPQWRPMQTLLHTGERKHKQLTGLSSGNVPIKIESWIGECTFETRVRVRGMCYWKVSQG